MVMMSLKTRLLRLEEANTGVKQPWHIGVTERMKVYEQIHESTANPDDPLVQECIENTKRYKQYFDDLEAGADNEA
jgi:hypothetical protein